MVYLETMYTITLSGELIEKFKAWTSEHACQRGIARGCVCYVYYVLHTCMYFGRYLSMNIYFFTEYMK